MIGDAVVAKDLQTEMDWTKREKKWKEKKKRAMPLKSRLRETILKWNKHQKGKRIGDE
jgi:hypothetical protein